MAVVEVKMDEAERAELSALMQAEQPLGEVLALMGLAALCAFVIQRLSGVGFEFPRSPLQAIAMLAVVAGIITTLSLLLVVQRSLTRASDGVSTRRKLLRDALEDQHVIEASGRVIRLLDVRSPRAPGGTLLVFLEDDTCLVLAAPASDETDLPVVDDSSTESGITLRIARGGGRILSLAWHGPRPEREMRLIRRPRRLLSPPRILKDTSPKDLEALVKRV